MSSYRGVIAPVGSNPKAGTNFCTAKAGTNFRTVKAGTNFCINKVVTNFQGIKDANHR
jgi:hypothetical protein